MNDTVSEDVKLDEAALEKAFRATWGKPPTRFIDSFENKHFTRTIGADFIRAYLAATKPASPLPGERLSRSSIASPHPVPRRIPMPSEAEIDKLIVRAQEMVRYPNVHFHYTDGAEVMSELVATLSAASAVRSEGAVGELTVLLDFLRQRAKGRGHLSKPDADRLIEPLLDAMIAVSSPDQTREHGIRDAAAVAYRVCAETRHVTLGDKARDAILSLLSQPEPKGE